MISIKDIIPITTVKRELMRLLIRAQTEGSTIVITKEGKAAGVLMSAEEYEGLMETLEILSDQACLKDILKAKREFESGKTFTHEQVFS